MFLLSIFAAKIAFYLHFQKINGQQSIQFGSFDKLHIKCSQISIYRALRFRFVVWRQCIWRLDRQSIQLSKSILKTELPSYLQYAVLATLLRNSIKIQLCVASNTNVIISRKKSISIINEKKFLLHTITQKIQQKRILIWNFIQNIFK